MRILLLLALCITTVFSIGTHGSSKKKKNSKNSRNKRKNVKDNNKEDNISVTSEDANKVAERKLLDANFAELAELSWKDETYFTNAEQIGMNIQKEKLLKILTKKIYFQNFMK